MSAGAAYLSGLALAAALAGAAGGKLRRPRTTAASLAALRLPAPAFLARAVPVTELAVAAALVVTPRVGGVAALALLAGFTAVLLRILRRGEAMPCACFGGSAERPVTEAAPVRNGALAGAAVLALAATGPVAPGLADAVVVSTAAMGMVALHALVTLRADAGSLFALPPLPQLAPEEAP